MKLLVITQKIDLRDDILGFMHEWIAEFARQAEQVTAIGLYVGEHDLPKNVRVISLGKEKLGIRDQGLGIRKILYAYRFWWAIWKYRTEYDAVFVHMNQVYIPLGFPLWKLLGKKISLWYAHGHVPFGLRVAEKLADIIFQKNLKERPNLSGNSLTA